MKAPTMSLQSEDYTKLPEERSITRRPVMPVYWIFAWSKVSGRPLVHGWYSTYDEAYKDGFVLIRDGEFEVVPLKTVDKTAARDACKAWRLRKANEVEEMFKRAKYKPEN